MVSPVWTIILKIWDKFFELIEIEIQCSENYLKTFLQCEEVVASKRNIEWFCYIPPENIEAPEVFWCFQGVYREKVTWNGLTDAFL